jgi:hypothetical protein
MAQAIPFPEATEIEKSVSGKYGPLPVKAFPESTLSCWRLSQEELAEINATGVVWVVTSTFDKLDPHPSGERWQPPLRVTGTKADGMRG